MTAPSEHPYLPSLRRELQRGSIDRREFLRTATLLGVAAGAAYAMAGLPATANAQTVLPKGGKIRIGMRVQEIKDPHTISWVEPSNVLRNTVQYLTRTDQDNVTHPELLEKWEASEDLKTWTLTIRQEAKWRSGRPFTADDAIWNIRRVLDPKTGSSVLGLMKGYMLEEYETGEQKNGKPVKSTRLWSGKAIEKIDDKTLRLNCKEPQLAVPEHLFHYPFFMLDPAENAAVKPGMNGTGPFELAAYNVGQNAVMKASAKYWGRPPYLDEVEFIDLGDDSGALIAALASKQVDGLYEVDFSELDAVKALPDVAVYPVTTAQTAVVRGKVRSEAIQRRAGTPGAEAGDRSAEGDRHRLPRHRHDRRAPSRGARAPGIRQAARWWDRTFQKPRNCWPTQAIPTVCRWKSRARTSRRGRRPRSR